MDYIRGIQLRVHPPLWQQVQCSKCKISPKYQAFCTYKSKLLTSHSFLLSSCCRCITSSPTNPNQIPEKPFACPVPGCKKRYKNVNGIKYHSKNGHKNDGKYVLYGTYFMLLTENNLLVKFILIHT